MNTKRTWSEDPPNQEGYWWVMLSGEMDLKPVKWRDGRLQVLCDQLVWRDVAEIKNVLWAGPIPFPAEP